MTRPQPWAGARRAPAVRARSGRVGRAAVVEAVADAMDEATLQGHVAGLVSMLALHHRVPIHHFHVVDSRRMTSGWPDSTITGPCGVIYRELKIEGEKPKRQQQVILDQLAAAGHDVGVWRPSDWLTFRVHREILGVAWPEGQVPVGLARAWGVA